MRRSDAKVTAGVTLLSVLLSDNFQVKHFTVAERKLKTIKWVSSRAPGNEEVATRPQRIFQIRQVVFVPSYIMLTEDEQVCLAAFQLGM